MSRVLNLYGYPVSETEVWNQVRRSLIVKHTKGLCEEAIFMAVELHQMGRCPRQACPLCRVDADMECMRNHAEPRKEGELLC